MNRVAIFHFRGPAWRAACVPVLFTSLLLGRGVCRADPAAERAAEKLAWEIESRRSVEIRVRTEISRPRSASGPERQPLFDTYTEHYIETATGQRYGEFRGLRDGQCVKRWANYCDGSRCAHVEYNPEDVESQTLVSITRQYWQEDTSDGKAVPRPLLYLYVGREPLHEALAKAEPLGESRVIGRPCDMFLFRGVRWNRPQDQVFHLDRETAIPLKVQSYRDDEARTEDKPFGGWTAESLEMVDGHPVPMKSTEVSYDTDGKPSMTWDDQVESIEFDKTYPASTFWPEVQPTANVFDGLTMKVEPAKVAPPPKEAEAESAAPTVEAAPPTGWGTYMPGIATVLGGAVLAAAGVLWWRNR